MEPRAWRLGRRWHERPDELMRALVVSQPNEFAVLDVPRPRPGPFEVLCRVRATAICGTDPHIIQGDYPGFWPKNWPLIPGHEWCGDIVETRGRRRDAGLDGGHAGRRHLARALRFLPALCRRAIQHLRELRRRRAPRSVRPQRSGAYAEFVVHSVRSVFAVPDALSDEEAAMLDPAAIALHTVVRGGHRAGDTVAVVGPGVMGLLVAECARALGAARVLVVGRGRRLKVAGELGHETVDFTEGDPVAAVRAATGGGGVDVALECSGAPQAVGQCVEMVRKGGRVAVIGIPLQAADLPMPRTVLDEIDVVGVRAAAGEMPRAIELAADGRIRLGKLITHRFALEDFAEAYATFVNRCDGALKVIVSPQGEVRA